MYRSRVVSIAGCLLGRLALSGGCGGAANTTPAAEAPAPGGEPRVARIEPAALAPQEAPDALLAVAIAAHPDIQLRGLIDLIDAVQPGAAAGMEPRALVEQLTSLHGGLPASAFDMEKPMYALFLDAQASPVVLVAAVADREALIENLGEGTAMRMQHGYAAIGAPEALEVVAAYALTRLREEPLPAGVLLPSALTLVLRFEQLMKRYAGELIRGLRALPADESDPLVRTWLEVCAAFLESLIQQIATMRFQIEPGELGLHVSIGLDARPGTTLSAFARAQAPSDFALLGSALQSGLDFHIGGHLDTGALPGLSDEAWATIVGMALDDAIATDAIRAHMKRWFLLMGNDLTLGVRIDALEHTSMRMQVRVDDEAEARALVAEWLDLVKRHPAAFKYRKPLVQTTRVEGVQVHTLTTEYAGTPEEQQRMASLYGPRLVSVTAVAHGRLSSAMGPDAQSLMREMLAREPVAQAVETQAGVPAILGMIGARRARASMAMHVDLVGFVARALGKGTPGRTEPGIRVDLGFAGDMAELRIHVPTAQILGVMAAARSP